MFKLRRKLLNVNITYGKSQSKCILSNITASTNEVIATFREMYSF